MNFKRKGRRNRGITLIALVITIIVLLILAGVTINAIVGNENVMEKAKEARVKDEEANEFDSIKLAVVNAMAEGNNGKVNAENLTKELNGLVQGGELPLVGAGPWTVHGKTTGKEYTIYENGNVTAKDGMQGDDPTTPGGETGEVTLKPTEDSTETPDSVEMSTDYGTIDIIWLSGKSNTPTTTPNKPVLKSGDESLEPVKFVEDDDKQGDAKWVKADESNTGNDWYNYDTDNRHWANARTNNNSYFVWIPRYAYRITYYAQDPTTVTENNAPTGYYDGFGMWNTDGKIKYALDKGIKTIAYNEKSYIVHPAFMKDIGINDAEGNLLPDYERGGWSDDLEGFWFAKFEMNGSTSNELNSHFGTQSERSQTIGTMYEHARNATFGYKGTLASDINANSFMNSHMVKNSEWGAVAYLTHSQYGLNGNKITTNACGLYESDYYKYWCGGGMEDAYIENTNQSTTGNVYGIYDMSGNAGDMVAAFNRLGNSSYLTSSNYGKNLTKYAKDGDNYISTKYITAYDNGTSDRFKTMTYVAGKIGDATKETFSWFGNTSNIVYEDYPFFERGDNVHNYNKAGIFSYVSLRGESTKATSFRISLCN